MKKLFVKDILILLIFNFFFILGLYIQYDCCPTKTILTSIIVNQTFINNIIIVCKYIFYLEGIFIILGLLSYYGFKINKGSHFIYRCPSKGKNLNNINFSESLPDWLLFVWDYKSVLYNEDLFDDKRYSLLKKIFLELCFIFSILMILCPICIIFFTSGLKSTILFGILSICFLYLFVEVFASLWIIYLKLARCLGLNLFLFLEKDFNQIINSHRFFNISIIYYEKLIQKEKYANNIKSVNKKIEKNSYHKINLIKDMLFGSILMIIVILGILFNIYFDLKQFISNNKFVYIVIMGLFYFLFIFILLGLFAFISFKINKGSHFIYKFRYRDKHLDNIDVKESFLNYKYYIYKRKILKFGYPTFLKKIFLEILPVLGSLGSISFFILQSDNSIFSISLFILLISWLPVIIYFLSEYVSFVWIFYMKFFRSIGFFYFLEQDFYKTVNYNCFFPININYCKLSNKL